MERVHPERLRDARERFGLLLQRRTRESDWQKLFAECPYILSGALPLRLAADQIRPMGRPGRSEPDFIWFPRPDRGPSTVGFIELKRPDSRILSVVRKDTVVLSRDAATAISQAQSYALRRHEFWERGDDLIFL